MGVDEFLLDFVDEAKSHIEKIENAFLDTEQFVKSSDMLNDVFRAIHSIKGTAGFFHLKAIVSLSHAMENVLGQLRSGKLSFSDDMLEALLSSNDLLKQMIYNVGESESVDISNVLSKLEEIPQKPQEKSAGDTQAAAATLNPPSSHDSTHIAKQENAPAPNSTSELLPITLDESHKERIQKLTKRGQKVYTLAISSTHTPRYHENIGSLFGNVGEIGEIIEARINNAVVSLKGLASDTPSELTLIITSVLEQQLLCEALELPPYVVARIMPQYDKPAQVSHTIKQEDSIRVNVKLLDSLMALSGELVLARNMLLDVCKSASGRELHNISQNIDSLTSKLQENIMLTRMQPLGVVFNKFPRVIHETAKALNKEINLAIFGKEIELDKTMLEALADPLIHLVRNAADHGIELPYIREQSGKPAVGSINLRAYNKSGMVAIEVSDDGHGIDIAQVKQKAIDKGIITPEQASTMTAAESFKLLFAPGFSTAKAVSDISGRGVGLDVVRSNIERLGGTVEITSKQGEGTVVTLLLPRTLAIMKSLIIYAAGQRFALPQTAVAQVVRLRQNDDRLSSTNGAHSFTLRGDILPVVNMSALLERDHTRGDYLIIMRAFKRQIALMAENVFDVEETLVKPLPSAIKDCGIYSGATIMGDGGICLILDPEGIVEAAGIHESEADLPKQKAITREIMLEHQNMILFSCSGTETYALDMNMVSRVERVPAESIELIGSNLFAKIKGKPLKIIRPEDYLPVQKQDYTSQTLTIIIPNLISKPMGILAESINDNIRAHFELDTEQIKCPGVFGTIVHDNRIALILNLYELFEVADPDNHPKTKTQSLRKRVLIVEDTPFFRHIEAQYLEDAGCVVTTAENGLEALEKLSGGKFDVIVSDIIMPVMDGLEFIKNVRKDPRYRNIPAIALTSMTSESYIDRAMENGFDAFENKLNKETLLKQIKNVTAAKGGA